MSKQYGSHAFPFPTEQTMEGWNGTKAGEMGMTMRQWYKGMALMGLLSKLPLIDQEGKIGIVVEDKLKHNADIAESCGWIAEAMIAEDEEFTKEELNP